MSKLLSAELVRMLKNKLFWIAAVLITLCEIYFVQTGARIPDTNEKFLDRYFFYIAPIAGLFFAAFISLFLGLEYSDHTIRNKLIVGYTRKQIYLSYYITCLAGVFLMEIGWFIGGMTAIPLLGLLTSDAKTLLFYFFVIFLFTSELTALLVGISMMTPNKASSAVTQIMLVLVLLFISALIYNGLCEPEMIHGSGKEIMSETAANPRYIGGTTRDVCGWILNISPFGQAILITHFTAPDAENIPFFPLLQIVSSIVLTALFLSGGMMIFKKKDLK